MNDQQSAMAILSLEECVDQYIADCRTRVDRFVARHYSIQETMVWQKQSLVTDLLYHPVNALWAIPSLFLKKLIEIPMKLGWRPGVDVISLLPTGFKTRYQREIERLVASELLEWPLTIEDPATSPNGLLGYIERHQHLGPLLKSGKLPNGRLRELSDIRAIITTHSSSRSVLLDAIATVATLATGWLVFGDHSLSISGIGEKIARDRAQEKAASTFILGSSLGSAFYSMFPPNPSFWEIAGATLLVGLFITAISLLVGLLSDPCLKRIGFQHSQLNMLIDAVEDYLHRQTRKHIKPVLRQLAA
ncbi:MAG: hypothetical protein HP491_10460 [Nitrospira sp.]|nr:hypothetical protein [Nitrospira sp.]MBH0183196.1 hypothetical protein [Nitrospira sp.]MBH0186065.1 hypothetical protein [Nitrospira sp.]